MFFKLAGLSALALSGYLLFCNSNQEALRKAGDLGRKPDHEVLDVIVNRWSPRAMTGENVSDEELNSLFEAARWAPSSYNNQPWRFVYVKRDSTKWAEIFETLVPFNQAWVKNAAAVIVIVSNKLYEHNKQFTRTHSFDTGSAAQNLMLQGSSMGLVVHGMSGFDYNKAAQVLKVPENYQVEAMYAVGRPAKKTVLPGGMQEHENPSPRKPTSEFAFANEFPG